MSLILYVILFFVSKPIFAEFLSSDEADCELIEMLGEDDSEEEWEDLDDRLIHYSLSFNKLGIDQNTSHDLLENLLDSYWGFNAEIPIPPPKQWLILMFY